VEVKRLVAKERSHAFKAWVAISAYLLRFKKVHKKVRLKEYRLVNQGLYKLESEERNLNCPVVGTNPNSLAVGSSLVPESPLANSFFNPSFSLLPNLISFNML